MSSAGDGRRCKEIDELRGRFEQGNDVGKRVENCLEIDTSLKKEMRSARISNLKVTRERGRLECDKTKSLEHDSSTAKAKYSRGQ